jgi:hypothetical protein
VCSFGRYGGRFADGIEPQGFAAVLGGHRQFTLEEGFCVIRRLDLGDLGPLVPNLHKNDISRHAGKVAASRACRNCRTAENMSSPLECAIDIAEALVPSLYRKLCRLCFADYDPSVAYVMPLTILN